MRYLSDILESVDMSRCESYRNLLIGDENSREVKTSSQHIASRGSRYEVGGGYGGKPHSTSLNSVSTR